MDRGPPPHYPGYLACEPAARSLFGCAASSTVSLPVGARWPPWPSWNHGRTSNDGIGDAAQRRIAPPSGPLPPAVSAVIGVSMGGRQTGQWGVQYPEFTDAMVPMISSPFPNAGSRGLVDFVPEAIIRESPDFNDENCTQNPSRVRLALLGYRILTSGAGALQNSPPTRADAERQVFEDTNTPIPDATDCIYQLRLNDGFDAWWQIDRI